MIRRRFDLGTCAWTLEDDPGPSAKDTGPVRWSVSGAQLEELAKLAFGHRVIEIGTGCGVSTEALARDAEYVRTYDVDDAVIRLVWPHLPENVTAVDRRVHPLSGGPYDVAFVDGLHTGAGLAQDIKELIPLMTPDAVWIFHDTHMGEVASTVEAQFEVIESYSDAGPTTMCTARLKT